MRILSLIFSICLHGLVLILALTIGASVRSRVNLDVPLYHVRLVSLSPGPAKQSRPEPKAPASEPEKPAKAEEPAKPEAKPVQEIEQPKPAPPKKAQPEPEPAKAQKPPAKPEPPAKPKPKDISPDKKQTTAPKPKKREPEKKKEPPKPSPEEVLAQALNSAKTSAAKERENEQRQVDQALQQLRKQVDQEARESVGGGGDAEGSSGAMEVYASIVETLVKKNWRYPAIGQNEELAATVEIDIDPSGAITGQRLTWGSGRPEFDSSVLKAVSQTGSLPPPPTRDISRITINFNLQELNP
jgi:colicin import membrane protein